MTSKLPVPNIRPGAVIGKLEVICEYRRSTYSRPQKAWLAKCSCGGETIVLDYHLRSRRTKSCGCLQSEVASERLTRHGHATRKNKSKEWTAWNGMISRCHQPNNQAYKDYGGRGIEVCPRWRDSFEDFLLDMGRAPSQQHTIERLDVNRGYSKDNCCWATKHEQSRNTRRNRFVTYQGKKMCLTDAAIACGIKPATLRYRLSAGLSIEEAVARG